MSVRETENTTPTLGERLRQSIRRDGAISFRDWMQAALYDEREGYYVRSDRERWGRAGDYRTSPERSPLFAATFACYFARVYEELGRPARWTIFEAGAGQGDFACGVLETLRRDFPQIFSATRYLIDEASEDGRRRMAERLKAFRGCVEFIPLLELTEASFEGIIFANELLDAFPVHRVRMCGSELRELFVGLDDAGEFVWIEDAPSTPQLAAYLTRSGVRLADGQTAEINLAAEDWMKKAASIIRRGSLILVDYGDEASELYTSPARRDGTLRAFYHHRFAQNTLALPGEQDLTTTINWTSIRQAGEELGMRTASFNRQDEFLMSAGILEQLESMSARAQSEAEAIVLRSGARELILPGGMSQSFQVLVLEKHL